MANYIDKYQDTINALTRKYKEKTQNDKLEREAFGSLQDKDFYNLSDQQRRSKIDAEKARLKTEYKRDLLLDIEAEQRKLAKEQQAEKHRLERLKVKAATGSQLVSEYAKANNLLESDARAELDDYAKVKRGRFEDGIADRYAAIRNLSNLKDLDLAKANTYYEQESERLGIKDLAKIVKDADYYVNITPGAAFDRFTSSGHALMQQMKNKE